MESVLLVLKIQGVADLGEGRGPGWSPASAADLSFGTVQWHQDKQVCFVCTIDILVGLPAEFQKKKISIKLKDYTTRTFGNHTIEIIIDMSPTYL